MSIFLHNIPALESYLQQEAQQTEGYVDVLQERITSSSFKGRSEKTFAQSVREACGVMGNVAPRQILKHVEDTIRRVHRRETYLGRSRIHTGPPLSVADIAEHRAKQQALDTRLTTILRRQLDRVEANDRFVEDIGVLVKETNALVGVGRS